MILSPQQSEAMLRVQNWLLDEGRAPYLYIAGYAGTGKTTIAVNLAELVGGMDRLLYAAFTGKAALQLSTKGCVGATTLHRILYSPVDKDRTKLLELTSSLAKLKEEQPDNRTDIERLVFLVREERKKVKSPTWAKREEKLSEKIKLLVLDECSMLSAQLLDDALSLGVPVLLLGDPFQLPPVMAKSPLEFKKPDVMLTEVHRQALDSPVLRAATNLRNGSWYEDTGDERFRVLHRSSTNYDHYAWADQILCARNKTRNSFNLRIRAKLIEKGSIVANEEALATNDRIVFLRNDHDEMIYNGTTAKVTDASFPDDESRMIYLDFVTDDNKKLSAYETWSGIIHGMDATEAPRGIPQSVDYAYALTVHKAQGSEWDKVLVYNEGLFGDDYKRWMYTAITRARTQCLVVNT